MRVDGLVKVNQIHQNQKKFVEFNNLLFEHQKKNDPNVQRLMENSEKVIGHSDFKSMCAMSMSNAHMLLGNDYFGGRIDDFTVIENAGYDKTQNSISLVPGMNLMLDNGVQLNIRSNRVSVDTTSFVGDVQYSEGMDASRALTLFIKYANGQNGSAGLNGKMRKEVLAVLEQNGININKPFTINGTEFNTHEHGNLEKSGVINKTFTLLPDHILRKICDSYNLDFDWDN